jgi:hypothetical protein
MAKNDRYIVNKKILPKKFGVINWQNTKEIEVYFKDDEKTYVLQVEDVVKDKNKINKILLSYNRKQYKRYLQVGQVLNGNLEIVFNYFGIRGNKLRPYRLSDDGTYWIGITDKGEEFYFNGENSEEIMTYNWHISNGYLIGAKNRVVVRLNRMVLGITDPNIIVNHCGRNKMDNRVEMLSISDHEDNAKELSPSILNNTGITGLTKVNENKYRIQCTVNGFSYTGIYNEKNKALIDLLIIQKNYDYRHNENLYHMLDNISEDYINTLINKVELSISNRKVNPIICKNRFELSEDGSFYYMYDKNNNRCKISIEDLELVKQGNWRYTLNNGKEYFSGDIIYQGKRKSLFLHRFLMDLIDPKYRHWYVDHFDSNGLDNTRENIVITDAKGNGLNKQRKDVNELKDKYKYSVRTADMICHKVFKTPEEGREWVESIKKELMKNRIEFKSRKELDEYLKSKLKNPS